MKRIHKLLNIMAATLICGAVITGCESNGGTNPEASVVTENVTAPDEEVSSEPVSSEPLTLEYLCVHSEVTEEDFEGVEESNLPILFAFELFIDFINLFLRLLELFGDSNN